ncbi:MAG: GNAT family N-acetyltransferase [Defluviitaleaceae bacterium]|nr:GNAT family N-acetyltransferase [Defluviitaleaceae bacterium]MCL2274717.1 GNAT family N-acetyltransferase [Defluviitaleaceae bacterium]
MGYFRKITGEHLYLSPFDAEDTEIQFKWAKWMNDRDVSDTFDGHKNHTSLSNVKISLQELTGYRYFIVLSEDDTLIGQISLHNVDHLHRNAFLGIMIGEVEYHGKGYGTEAAQLVLDYGFNTLNLNNIALSVHEDNHAGIACYKKLGFKEYGRRREAFFKNGKFYDVIYMDILAREFNKYSVKE